MAAIFQPLKQGSVKTRVAEAIRGAIYAGKLRPGDALLELQLARDFRVSQTSVREALIHLEQMGLVRRVANKGTFVTELTIQQVRERVEIRSTLECIAAVQAGPRMNEEVEKKLRTLADRIAFAKERHEYFESAQADLEFHRVIWRLAENETLYQILDQVAAPLFAFVSILRSRRQGSVNGVFHPHHEIVNALVEGDAGAIRKTVANHFTDSYEEFLRLEDREEKDFSQRR